MTDLSKKMDSIANNGYRADMARRISTGQEDRMVKQAIILDIIGAMQDLDGDTLTELYEHVKFLRSEARYYRNSPLAGNLRSVTGRWRAWDNND